MSSDGWLRRGRMLFLLVPLLLVALLFGAFALFLHRSGSRIRHYESLALARKEPLTLEELARTYTPIPDDENAAVPLLNLWRSEDPEFWAAFEAGERQLPRNRPEQPIPFPAAKGASKVRSAQAQPDDLGPLADHVAARREHREAVRQALQRKSFRFPVRISDGFAALLPQLARIKREAEEFQAEGWVATERGDTTTALRAIRDSAKIGGLLRDDPFLIGQLVRIACDSMCLSQAERLLSRQTLAEPQLLELQAVLSTLYAADGFHRGMVGERATGLAVFRDPHDIVAADPSIAGNAPGEQSGFYLAMSALRLTGLKQADQALYLETFEHVLTNAPLDSPARLLAVENVMNNIEVQAKRFPPKIFTGMLLPALSKTANKFAYLEALRSAALAAVAIERHRLSHGGKLPETLSELVPAGLPEIPRDPFDGQPLRYRRLERGYVVYSVGADRTDDGGKEKPKKSVSGPFDVTFMVRR